MSWQATTWVLEFSISRLGSRLVLFSIASHANREGRMSFPSLKTIARETRLSKVQVIHCIRELEGIGELSVQRSAEGRGKINHYTLSKVGEWVKSFNPSQLEERVKSTPERVKFSSKRVKPTLPEPMNSSSTVRLTDLDEPCLFKKGYVPSQLRKANR